MIQEWGYSAKILIYHYRAILKGMIPFASVWDDSHEKKMREQCGLGDAAVKYIRQVAEIIKDRGKWSKTMAMSTTATYGTDWATDNRHRT